MTPLALCSSCHDLVCFTFVVTGRGGESSLCSRCYRTPASPILKQVKVTKPARPATGQLTIGGKR